MIIPDVDKKIPLENPPTYSASIEDQPLPASIVSGKLRESTPTQPSAQPSSPAPPSTNFLDVFKKDGKIKGAYSIDPTLSVPESLLAPMQEGETERPNACFKSRDGGIKVDLHFVEGSGPLAVERAVVVVDSKDGAIALRLHRPLGGPKIALRIKNSDGSTKVSLPRNFNGPISYKNHGGEKVSFLPSLQPHVTTFSMNSEGPSHVYVGDRNSISDFAELAKGWKGDEIFIENWHGQIKFQWTEDDEEKKEKRTERQRERGQAGRLARARDAGSSKPAGGFFRKLRKPQPSAQ